MFKIQMPPQFVLCCLIKNTVCSPTYAHCDFFFNSQEFLVHHCILDDFTPKACGSLALHTDLLYNTTNQIVSGSWAGVPELKPQSKEYTFGSATPTLTQVSLWAYSDLFHTSCLSLHQEVSRWDQSKFYLLWEGVIHEGRGSSRKTNPVTLSPLRCTQGGSSYRRTRQRQPLAPDNHDKMAFLN